MLNNINNKGVFTYYVNTRGGRGGIQMLKLDYGAGRDAIF